MSERPTPETDAAEAKRRAEWLHKHKAPKNWIILTMFEVSTIRTDLMALERERDEAREALAEEIRFHHRTHSELIQTQCRLMDMTQSIILTLEENRNLSDGDDCTLAKLKSVVPDWK